MAEGMIERAARSAFYRYFLELPRTGDGDPDTVWSQVATEEHRELWREITRAAITAMREPTQTMISAANRLNHPRDEEVWRAMIDTAINEHLAGSRSTSPPSPDC